MQHVGGLPPDLVDSAVHDGAKRAAHSDHSRVCAGFSLRMRTLREEIHAERKRCSSRRNAASGVQSGRGFMLAGQQACPWAVAHAGRRSGKQAETRRVTLGLRGFAG